MGEALWRSVYSPVEDGMRGDIRARLTPQLDYAVEWRTRFALLGQLWWGLRDDVSARLMPGDRW